MSNSELHGGHGQGEEASQPSQRTSIIDRMRQIQPGTKSSIRGGVAGVILGAGLSTLLYYGLKDLPNPYPEASVRLTPNGGQEVILGDKPLEAKCKDGKNRMVGAHLLRDERDEPKAAVVYCRPTDPTK